MNYKKTKGSLKTKQKHTLIVLLLIVESVFRICFHSYFSAEYSHILNIYWKVETSVYQLMWLEGMQSLS